METALCLKRRIEDEDKSSIPAAKQPNVRHTSLSDSISNDGDVSLPDDNDKSDKLEKISTALKTIIEVGNSILYVH